ncbi:hypothetical protein ACIQZO_18340 [Streptomyces sp. NPDC097617]|uniref:hypothetical protein n=1 Tax=Streptomyces sp. NPDC097617 TaxID=3366091 RepID=UPI00380AAD78
MARRRRSPRPTWNPAARCSPPTAAAWRRGTPTGDTLTARTIASVAAGPDGDGTVRIEHSVAEGRLLAPALSPSGRIAWLSAAPGPRKAERLSLYADGRPVPLDGDLAPAPPRWIGDDRLLITLDGRFRVIRPHRDGDAGHDIPLDATLEVPRPRYRLKEYVLEAERSGSDWLFRMPSLHLAQAQSAGGGLAHVYELTWSAPGMGGVLGACHGLDVPLVFGNLERGRPAALIGETPSPEAQELSARMRDAWTGFAAHGDPGWPAYDTGQRLVRLFGTGPALAAYPEEASRLIWQDHAFTALPLLGP